MLQSYKYFSIANPKFHTRCTENGKTTKQENEVSYPIFPALFHKMNNFLRPKNSTANSLNLPNFAKFSINSQRFKNHFTQISTDFRNIKSLNLMIFPTIADKPAAGLHSTRTKAQLLFNSTHMRDEWKTAWHLSSRAARAVAEQRMLVCCIVLKRSER